MNKIIRALGLGFGITVVIMIVGFGLYKLLELFDPAIKAAVGFFGLVAVYSTIIYLDGDDNETL